MSGTNLPALFGNLQNIDAGGCPGPFIGESLYPYSGGFKEGRNCAPNPLVVTGNASRCCIPCPVFDWTYPDHFKSLTDGAAWVNVAGFILCAFLLVSHALLPATATRRSWLNIILLVAIMILELGFIVPLARQPDQCFDPITPNGQSSSLTCAFSGAFVAFGLMTYVTWILVRSLVMHIQICWNISPGALSYWAANIGAWSTIIALTTATLAHAGVSFRFGGYCHVNVGSLATYWGWLLGFGGLALLLQIATFAYCIKVYLSSALQQRRDPSNKSPSVISSSRSRTARATARRVKQVVLLQWRSFAIVILAIFTAAFFCVMFIVFDDKYTIQAFANTDSLIPWIVCVISTQDKNQCLQYTGPILIKESFAVASLFILAFVGIEAFFLLCRFEVFTAWWALLRTPFWKKKARRASGSNFDILMSPNKNTKFSESAQRDSTLVGSPTGAETERKTFGKQPEPGSPVSPISNDLDYEKGGGHTAGHAV
ncbi:uncharacterized protein MYCFIDRAFT_131070 [Pseudocercospora fijiensis CIRAD86]|uniref:G-protein coupled receptors family 2 profile 2 domain-containing protein n=1 Tax=Pseudocercospora fijiensis (strain CIRAD86) TaxID=383855 RepID=M3BC63_PSEFD|nr:uncharacterized protein MYCFIDRAFT_131070 [Pseudocercospora fijiensis CIRAD86]EME86872.1 hypothetical protein MYCFIDRAFT_131070 [Pseudocercospora fijiensis CIRAD86]